jgi:hypothetical protein
LLGSRKGRGVGRKKFVGRGVSSVLGTVGMVFLVVVVGFIGGCGGEQDSGSPVDEAAEQEDGAVQKSESGETESSEEPVAASIGEPITVGDVQWTVTDAEQTDVVISRFGSKQGNFVIVDVTFLNNSNQDITLATPFLPLLDSEGREFESDIEDSFFHVYAEENMFVDHVTPGTTKEGKIIFAVAPDASGFKLQVGEAKFASNETKYIDLGF